MTDNGPCCKAGAFARYIQSRPEFEHVRTRHRSPETNGVIERFFQSVKYEHLYLHEIDDGPAVAEHVAGYEQIYNDQRPHEAIAWALPRPLHPDPTPNAPTCPTSLTRDTVTHAVPADWLEWVTAWRREHATAWVAAVDRMLIGEYSHAPNTNDMRAHGPRAVGRHQQGAAHQRAARVLQRSAGMGMDRPSLRSATRLSVPRSVAALIGPQPRVIAGDIWAKLMWAGLNLAEGDLPAHSPTV